MRMILMLCLLVLAGPLQAVIDAYSFDSEAQRERYQTMIDELRCPKCQNQNLAGSNAPIAQDLRRQLHRLIEEGQSDAEIREFMVDRYGNFILYRPPVDKNTVVLWLLPLLLLAAGLLVAVRLRRGRGQAGQAGVLTAAEKIRIEELLERYRRS